MQALLLRCVSAVVLASGFSLLSLTASAEAFAGLADKLSVFSRLSGDFEQTLYAEDGDALQVSQGSFALLRPGYLRWEIRSPEAQLLVAAGDVLWHHDIELETATRREISPSDPTSPLTILSGDVSLLQTYYSVEETATNRYMLRPRFPDAEFRQVELVFAQTLPSLLTIVDIAGRSSVIQLSKLNAAAPLTAEDFVFEPPEGVDVYRNDL